MIKIQLQPETEAQLAAEAHASGVALKIYVRDLVEQKFSQEKAARKKRRQPAADVVQFNESVRRHSVGEAIENIRNLRKGNNLGGLKVKDLVHEGHKY